MPEQSYEDFQFERSHSINSPYEGSLRDHSLSTFQGERLIIHKSPKIQRILLALASLILWISTLFCLILAWSYTYSIPSGNLNFARIIILALVPFLTLFFAAVNIFFGRVSKLRNGQ
ncbi:hypothetical protein [Ktedonobacter robiniae]|uniref:hypothetical protein n=1 Tax=Ktedonobacter robiniae TaxID=2778365 RepID=UPI0019155B1A|nr:hypothetical protein [Ktedonobacter robiniae]